MSYVHVQFDMFKQLGNKNIHTSSDVQRYGIPSAPSPNNSNLKLVVNLIFKGDIINQELWRRKVFTTEVLRMVDVDGFGYTGRQP